MTNSPTLTFRDRVDLAISAVGGRGVLAYHLKISGPAISQWKRVPAERVREVSRLSGIPDYELRPDLYEQPQPQAANT